MGAPLSNQFWKNRSKHGRDKLFGTAAILKEEIETHFNWVDKNPWWRNDPVKSGDLAGQIIKVKIARPYTLAGLCVFLGVNTKYFNDFEDSLKGKEDPESKDFSEVILWAKEVIYTQKFEGAAVGAFNANIISRDLGLAEKTENKHEVTLEQITGMEFK